MATATHAIGPVAGSRERARLRDLGAPVLVPLALILLVALGVRLYGALNPVVDPGPDAEAYERIAQALFETGRYGVPEQTAPTDWSPGAPLLFSVVYHVVGSADPTAARVFVALLGVAMVLCVFLIGLRMAGAAAGLVAALLIATYPTYIENTGQLLSEPLAAFLLSAGLLAFLWAADHRMVLAWALPGLIFGYLILTRPEYQAITAAFAVLAAFRVFRDRGWKLALVSALVLVAAAGLVVMPWVVRNRVVLGKWVPVTTGGGKALFVATYLPGDGRQVPTKRALMRQYLGAKDPITTKELRAQPMTPLLNRVAEDKYPDMPRDEALGRIGKENLRKYLSEQPVAYIKMSARKFWNVWSRGSSPYMRDWGWVAYHRLLLLLGLAGFVVAVLAAATRYRAIVLAMPIAAISVLGTILLAVPRRQVPLMPIVCVFAGIALVSGVRWVRSRVSNPA